MNNSEVKVGIICPLGDEYNICKEVLDLKNESEISGRLISKRIENNVEVYAIKAGVGKINCSSATQLIIDEFHTDFIIDAGVAGSLTEDININDIVCGKYSFEYDASMAKSLGKEPVGDDKSYSMISNPSYKKEFEEFANYNQRTMGINIQFGNIACGEHDVNDTQLKQKLHQEFDAIACNWETSAVLKVAKLNEIKSLSFRVIVDEANESMEDFFDKNCKPALQKMFPVLKEFLFSGWIKKFY